MPDGECVLVAARRRHCGNDRARHAGRRGADAIASATVGAGCGGGASPGGAGPRVTVRRTLACCVAAGECRARCRGDVVAQPRRKRDAEHARARAEAIEMRVEAKDDCRRCARIVSNSPSASVKPRSSSESSGSSDGALRRRSARTSSHELHGRNGRLVRAQRARRRDRRDRAAAIRARDRRAESDRSASSHAR